MISDELASKLREAAKVPLTPKMIYEQRISWIIGQQHGREVKRDEVVRVLDELGIFDPERLDAALAGKDALKNYSGDWLQAITDIQTLCRQLELELQAERERGRRVREVADAAIEFESYLGRVNTQERQSIVFSVPDDDTSGVAMAGFCERLSKLSHAIRALSRAESGEK